jgi:hypothetical protein
MDEESHHKKSTEIFSKSDIFSVPQEAPGNSPQKATNSPRFHHKKPSKKRTNMRNPPVKMRNHHAKKNPAPTLIHNWQLGLSPVVA